MPVESDEELRELLELNSIAVVGCSSTPGKDAHQIPAYMRDQNYDITPVNPYAEEVFGSKAYDSLADVEGEIDLVDVFRPSEEVSGIVDEAIARKKARGDVQAVWTQLGIVDEKAAERAEAAGLKVVMDRCLKVEHERLF